MRQDVFGVAYQEAKSELLDLTCKFEELRKRKERLENVVAALAPMLGVPVPAPVALPPEQPAAAPAVEETKAEAEPVKYSFTQVNAPEKEEEESENESDPFQRRIRNALRFGGHSHEGLQHAV